MHHIKSNQRVKRDKRSQYTEERKTLSGGLIKKEPLNRKKLSTMHLEWKYSYRDSSTILNAWEKQFYVQHWRELEHQLYLSLPRTKVSENLVLKSDRIAIRYKRKRLNWYLTYFNRNIVCLRMKYLRTDTLFMTKKDTKKNLRSYSYSSGWEIDTWSDGLFIGRRMNIWKIRWAVKYEIIAQYKTVQKLSKKLILDL